MAELNEFYLSPPYKSVVLDQETALFIKQKQMEHFTGTIILQLDKGHVVVRESHANTET